MNGPPQLGRAAEGTLALGRGELDPQEQLGEDVDDALGLAREFGETVMEPLVVEGTARLEQVEHLHEAGTAEVDGVVVSKKAEQMTDTC